MDDATITGEVKLKLMKNSLLQSRKISVETTNGVVNLTGAVRSPDEEKQAIAVARNVRGVKAVRENLEVH